MEVQLERDALPDTRQKELQSQENEKLWLKNTIRELEAVNQLQEGMLRKAESQTEHLKKMVHSHKEVLLELAGILMDYKDSRGRKLCGHENITSLLLHSLSTATVGVLRDLDSEVSCLKEKVVLVEEELQSLKKGSQTQKELLLQQLQIREQARTPNSVHPNQVSHLESTVSQLRSKSEELKRVYENKVKDLEKQLHVACSEPAEAHTEQDQCGQEPGNLRDQIHQLLVKLHKKEIELSLEKKENKRFWDQNADNSITMDQLRRQLDNKNQQLQSMEEAMKEMMECRRQMECQMAAIKEKNESVGRISSLSVRLEATKETLRKAEDDLAAKEMDLEAAGKRVSDLTACLQEKERALGVTSQELKELHSQLGSSMQELQHLKNEEGRLHKVQPECETLKLQLLEKERIIGIFQKQIDNMTRIMGQHGQAAGAMGVEKSKLRQEINDWKLKVEELQVAKDEKEGRIREVEARLSELELEKVQLLNTCTERLRALKDVKQEKDQLMDELQAGRSNLAGLAESFEDLERDYQDKIEEMEDTANRLKTQLKSAQAELKQARTALNTMEGSAGSALEAAVRMQKQITAKRGQIDALQSKIKFLEEAMANAAEERHYLREENCKLSEKLSCISAENIRFAGELDILRARDQRLKERLSNMETALDKASMQFAECQGIIQCQEQEAMRFRLQHTLDVKELRGPGYSSASASGRLWHAVPLSHLHPAVLPLSLPLGSPAPQMLSKLDILKEEPLQDLKRILQELTDSDSDIPSVDLGGSGGRTSPLAAVSNAVDPSSSHAADLQPQDVSLPFTALGIASICSAARCYTSSPKKISRQERDRAKSPVHLLLTTLPDDLGSSASPGHRPSTRNAGSSEGAATAPQIASQPVESSKHTPRRLQNKMESLEDLVELLQMKNQATSPVIRTQEVKTKKSKEKENKLSK